MPSENLKICSICKVSKHLSEYNKNKNKKDGLQTLCRECSNKKSRNYYNENRELHKKNTVARNKKNKIITQQYVYNLLKTNGCIDCGENDPCCLDFDHQRDKKEMISVMIHCGNSLSTIVKEIEKCEIRCSNCHRKKTAKDFNWYHNIDTGTDT
jgi:hypothetical protein